MGRTFQDMVATRQRTPVLVGLVGPSGSGKTFSALRLAGGIQRVCGGETFFIDTEARRALHYADHFKFRHVEFGAPFSPLDYLEAVEYCVAKGATTIVIDSLSHEHEGPGGVLEMHSAEVEKKSGGDPAKAERVKIGAWALPKAARRRFINSLLQLRVNLIACFRAKEKLKVVTGQPPVNRGYQPIAGEEFIYEMTLKCLMLPGSNGTPIWGSEFPDEAAMIKLPEQFREFFSKEPRTQLTEDVGEMLATWAAGSSAQKQPEAAGPKVVVEDLIAGYEGCLSTRDFAGLEKDRATGWKALSAADKARLKGAADKAQARLQEAA